MLFHGVPAACIAQASATYGVPKRDILALMENEGAAPGIASVDPNGTTDLGPMQVNTCHLPRLQRYGYSYYKLLNNPCANVMAGTWVFARCLRIEGDLIGAAGCYNAGPGDLLAAWQDGYVQRFAEHLGLRIAGQPIQGPAYQVAQLTIEGGQ